MWYSVNALPSVGAAVDVLGIEMSSAGAISDYLLMSLVLQQNVLLQ